MFIKTNSYKAQGCNKVTIESELMKQPFDFELRPALCHFIFQWMLQYNPDEDLFYLTYYVLKYTCTIMHLKCCWLNQMYHIVSELRWSFRKSFNTFDKFEISLTSILNYLAYHNYISSSPIKINQKEGFQFAKEANLTARAQTHHNWRQTDV
jgi:hypothetical protein